MNHRTVAAVYNINTMTDISMFHHTTIALQHIDTHSSEEYKHQSHKYSTNSQT